MTVPLTTIKVPKSVRERVSREAQREGLTAAELITSLLDAHDRRARFDAVRNAYSTADASYVTETEEWDSLAGDGLPS